MSKESILDKLDIQSQGDYFRQDVLEAMDEWAEKQAIDYLHWVLSEKLKIAAPDYGEYIEQQKELYQQYLNTKGE